MEPRYKKGEKAYINLPVEVKSIDKENFTLEAVFSTQDVDRHGDIVLQEGWDLTNFKKNPVILNSHNYGDAAEVIGKASNVRIEGKKLIGLITFAVNENPKAKIIFDLYAGGFLNAFSVGFIPKKFKQNKDGTTDWFVIEEAELLETSAVSVPANARALAKEKGIDLDVLEKDIENTDDKDETPKVGIVQKNFGENGVMCMYCTEDITEETKQFQLPYGENMVELVCESCYDEKTKKKKPMDGDPCEMPDGEPGEMHPNDDGEMVCMPKKKKEAELEPEPALAPEEKKVSYNSKVIHAITNIESKEKRQLRQVASLLDSLINDDNTGLNKEVKEKVKNRKVNQAIRGLMAIK